MPHNPEAIRREGKSNTTIEVNEARCQGCGLCANVCPKGAIHISEGLAVVDQGQCDLCIAQPEALCVSACPHQAIYPTIRVETHPESPAETRLSREVSPIAVNAKPPSIIGQLARSPALHAFMGFIGKEILPRALDTFLARWDQSKGVTASSHVNESETLPESVNEGVSGLGRRVRRRRGGRRHGRFSRHERRG